MDKMSTKNTGLPSPMLDSAAKLAVRKRVVGLWKGKVNEIIEEGRKIRKEWDKQG